MRSNHSGWNLKAKKPNPIPEVGGLFIYAE